MPFLYLIRHPKTLPDPTVPGSQWQISEEGLAQVDALLTAPLWGGVATIYTSQEHKAAAVGEAVQAAFGIPFVTVEGLHEARRDDWVDPDTFPAAQASFFSRPQQAPLSGWESAQEASARFAAAMSGILAHSPTPDTIAVVAHGTVLTLYLAHLQREQPSFEAWRRLGFAEVMALDRATLRPITPFLAAPYDGVPYTRRRPHEDRHPVGYP